VITVVYCLPGTCYMPCSIGKACEMARKMQKTPAKLAEEGMINMLQKGSSLTGIHTMLTLLVKDLR
jgi:hypothetical protein